MARLPKPWFRSDRNSWFVTIGGVRHNLGPNKKRAHEKFHELMRAPKAEVVELENTSFAVIADAFLEWVKQHRSPDTFEWYRYRIERFCQKYPDLNAQDLKPFHVQTWVDSYGFTSKASKRNYIRSIKRCVKWALQQGYLNANPVESLESPGAEARDLALNSEEFNSLLSFIPDQSLRDICKIAYETGCRPQELLRVEARHFQPDKGRWVFPVKESKGKRAPRIVYLPSDCQRISKDYALKYPIGKMFRNRKGKPWTVSAVNCAFRRVRQRMGKANMLAKGIDPNKVLQNQLAALNGQLPSAKRSILGKIYEQYAVKYSLYTLRHSWATNALRTGMDALTVAVLMGHSDPSTLSRVYQHLAHSPEHMLEQAKRAIEN